MRQHCLIALVSIWLSLFSATAQRELRTCSVLVVGGSLGGVAAAIESASSGVDTCFVVESGWIGGQMTSQGVSAVDEAFFDTSPAYEEILAKIRHHYKSTYNIPNNARGNAADGGLNPGPCWKRRRSKSPILFSVLFR